MDHNIALPTLASCFAGLIRAKLAGGIHLVSLWFFHLHSFSDECSPFKLSRTLFHQLRGFYHWVRTGKDN
jgi:hypothetical protein